MATENKVTAIGTSTHNGETKVRFTADLVTRSKCWSRFGIDADFVELPEPMDRLEALRFLQTHERFQTADRARAILEQILLKESYIRRDERRAKRQTRKAREEAVKTLSLDAIRARKVEEIS